MKILLAPDDHNRLINAIKNEVQYLMDNINIPGCISVTEKERVIRDITSISSRIDVLEKLPAALKAFVLQHKVCPEGRNTKKPKE